MAITIIVRILCGIALAFAPAFSVYFYAIFLVAAAAKAADQITKANADNEFLRVSDFAADCVLAGVCIAKLFPAANAPIWVYIWIGLIVLIKITNIVSGYVVQKKFVVIRSAANAAAGALMLILPFTIGAVELKYSAAIVCAAETFAAIKEGHFIRTNKDCTRK